MKSFSYVSVGRLIDSAAWACGVEITRYCYYYYYYYYY